MVENLLEMFPSIPKHIIESEFKKLNGNMEAVVEALLKLDKEKNQWAVQLKVSPSKPHVIPPTHSNSVSSNSSVSPPSTPSSSSNMNEPHFAPAKYKPPNQNFILIKPKKKKKEKTSPQPQSTFREEASQIAHMRNEYFRNATQAYLHGDGALAKQLSERVDNLLFLFFY